MKPPYSGPRSSKPSDRASRSDDLPAEDAAIKRPWRKEPFADRDDRSDRDRGERGGDRGDRSAGNRNAGKGPPWRRFSGQRPRPSASNRLDEDGVIRLYGLHPVEAALRNPARIVTKLTATDNAARKLEAAISARGLTPIAATPRDLDRQLGADTVHQGIVIEVEPLPEPELADLARDAIDNGRPLVVLDQVTDPHNVGAVLRSAAVFGASGLVMTRRHSAPLGGTLAKSASGALELVPIALVQNLARAIAELKDLGLRVLALDGDGPTLLEDERLNQGVALVLGAEGKGLRQSTREGSDAIVAIASGGALDSLNVSNAAAIGLHLAAMQRRRSPS